MSARAFGGTRDSYLAYRKSLVTGRCRGSKPSRRRDRSEWGADLIFSTATARTLPNTRPQNRPGDGGLIHLAATVHWDQLANTMKVIDEARTAGHERLIEQNEQIKLNLVRIIEGLEALLGGDGGDGG